jgi:cytidine deaminase
MKQTQHIINMEEYASAAELNAADAALLQRARETTVDAYAPYSNFRVAAAASLANGAIVTGTNQENASYPVGTCAERVLLGSVASQFKNIPIDTIAITYDNVTGKSNHPVAPCGMCRQSLVEYENRMSQPIRLILSGKEGKVFILPAANLLLPLAFLKSELLEG